MTARHVVVFVLLVALAAPVVAVVPGSAAAQADGAETGGCSYPFSKADATGTTVTLDTAPNRIVTLNPSAAQTVYEISASDDPAWDRVVGVSRFARYLSGVSEKTTVGDGVSDATVERTVALSPDLVLAPNTIPDATVRQLRDAGLTVYKFRAAASITGDASGDETTVVEKTRLTGRLVGECEGARNTADSMENDLDIVREALRDEERPKGIYYFFGYTAGSGTFVDEVMTTGGLENVAATGGANANQSSGYFVVNPETVVAADPAWFVLNSDDDETRVPEGPNDAFTETTAYREGNAVVLDANEVSQPAPRIVDAVLDVAKAVHPEAYREEISSRLDRDDLGGPKQVRATTLADGSVRLEARNVGRDERVSFALPPRRNGSVHLQRVNVSLAEPNPTFTIDLRHLGDDDGPTPLNGTRSFGRFAMAANGLPAEDVDGVRVRFAVNESVLSAQNATPENVTAYRRNGTAWTPLDTRVVGAANGSVVFETTAPGVSTYFVGVPETAAARAITATPAPETESTPTAEQPDQATTTAAPSVTTTRTSSPSTTTTTALPGFGASLAALALLLSSLAIRRRDL